MSARQAEVQKPAQSGLPFWRLSRLFLQGIPLVILLLAVPTSVDGFANGATDAALEWLDGLWYALIVSIILGSILEYRARRRVGY